MIRVAWYAAIVLATLGVLLLIWQFSVAIVLFVLSLAFAAALRPVMGFLQQRGLPRGASLVLGYGMVLLALIGILVLSGGPLINELQKASNGLLLGYERLVTNWQGTEDFRQNLVKQLPTTAQLYQALTQEKLNQFAAGVLGVAVDVASVVAKLAIILILSVYWTADQVRFERLWLSLLPVARRASARNAWRAVESGVGAYIRHEVVQTLLAGFVLWMGYQAMGIPYPTLLAVFGALARIVPWLGVLLAAIPPALIGLQVGPAMAVIAPVYTLIVLISLEYIIRPRFFPGKRYSSMLLIVIVLALGLTYGLVGVILAPPLAVAISILFGQYYPSLATTPAAAEGLELPDLKLRLSEVQQLVSNSQEPISPEMASLLDRLGALVEKTQKYLQRS